MLWNRTESWGTMAMAFLKLSMSTSRMSLPAILIVPDVGSKNLDKYKWPIETFAKKEPVYPPVEQTDNGGLAGSGTADDGDPLARRNSEAELVQDPLALDVLEHDLVKGDFGLFGGQGEKVGVRLGHNPRL